MIRQPIEPPTQRYAQPLPPRSAAASAPTRPDRRPPDLDPTAHQPPPTTYQPPDDLDDFDEPEPNPRHRPSREYREPADYPEPPESPADYQRTRDRRAARTVLIANIVRIATALIALAFVLHIVFTLFGANQNSGFVAFDYDVAKIFVFGFGDVFTPNDAKLGLIANYGLAAIVYLVVGRVIYRTLRRA